MRSFRLTIEAEQDIDEIAAYTIATWGWRQAHLYLTRLEDGFTLVAQNPSIGRSCDDIQSGLQRFEIAHHVAFYTAEKDGVLIVRVLHERMLPAKYV